MSGISKATDERDIIERLNGACIGHPFARIAWPHRLLHDARDEIERLRDALDMIRRRCDDNGETPADRGGKWAAEVARVTLDGGSYQEQTP